MASPADICVFGGSAYGGKSVAVLLWMLQVALAAKTSCIVFRRESPRLFGGGSIWEESHNIYRGAGGVPRQSPSHEWRFPNGSTIEFSHMQYEHDAHNHQGKRYQCVVFEEATEFLESQFWFLWGRTATKSGVRRHVRMTCNPDPSSFVRKLIDWWIDEDGLPIGERSGVLRWFVRDVRGDLHWFDARDEALAQFPNDRPASLTFIPARTSDNKLGDPHYAETLKALPLVMRARMLGGNWNIQESSGNVLRREWFPVVDALPSPPLREVRGWDKGAVKDGDATAGAKVVDLGPGKGWAIVDIAESRGTPGERKVLMTSTAMADDATVTQAIWQDPGAAGIYDAEQTAKDLAPRHVLVERAAKGKVQYAGTWASLAEAGFRGEGPRIYVLRAPWNDRLFGMMDAFDGKDGGDDDWIDAISRAFLELLKHSSRAGDDGFVPQNNTPRGGFH